MKKLFNLSMLAIAAMAAFSCTVELVDTENEDSQFVKTPLIIEAYADDDIAPDTKTTLNGVSIRWANSDAIVGYEGSTKHTSTSTEPQDEGKKAVFTFSDVSVDTDLDYLIYPAAAAGAKDEGTYNIILPSEQAATVNSFANGANLALAAGKVDDEDVVFKNIGALIGFSISNDNVTSVEVSANEAMTGHALVTPGSPVAPTVVKDGLTYVEMTGGIANGSQYYAVVYPGTYTGLTIKVRDNSGKMATYTNPNALTLARNDNLQIADLTVAGGKWQTLKRTAWSHNFSSQAYSGNGTETLSGKSWTLAGDGGYWGHNDTKGAQFGSGASPYTALTLTSNFGTDEGVNEIVINAATASDATAQISVSVGGHPFKCGGSLSTALAVSNNDYDFKSEGDVLYTGDIVITITQSTSKALYIKAIDVNPLPRVETPVITIAANTATITCATEGASIYYTNNGSTPTASSTLYTTGFSVAKDVTIKAIAIKDGYRNSEIASKTNESIATLNFSYSAAGISNNTAIGNVALPDGMKYDTGIAASNYKCYADHLGMRANNCAYIVRFDVAASSIDFTGKGQGASGNNMIVSGSADGSTYTEIETISINESSDTKKTVSKSINSSYRFIKFTFSKNTGNYALKEINIKK